MKGRWTALWIVIMAVALWPIQAIAAEVKVAVAANFTGPMKIIATAFELDTGHRANLAFGATGQFYAQIRNGAPFHVLLAADDKTPARLAQEGLGLKQSVFTYAIGRLVLWSRQAGLVDAQGESLKTGRFEKIAMANPRLAPYGVAAMQVLHSLGLNETTAPRIVEGSNIAQTFQFVASGNASVGFVAASQVFRDGRLVEGSGWVIPPDLYSPIRQDAVLLEAGQHNAAAVALMNYLRSDKARAIKQSFGYE